MWVEKIISHPEFERDIFLNDINLIILKESFEITDYVRPACLPQSSAFSAAHGAACVASGFGKDGTCDINERFHATNLKNVVLDIVDNEICAQKLGFDIENSQLCAA